MSENDGPRRVAVVNAFSDDNVGGAAITHATLVLADEVASGGDVALVAVAPSSNFEFNRRVRPALDVLDPPFTFGSRLQWLRSIVKSLALLVRPTLGRGSRTLDHLRRCDVVISKGGYVYRERDGGLGALVSGWFTMWPFLFAVRCGAAGVVYSASIGPFSTRRSRALARFVLRRATVICPRDPDSMRRLTDELGIDASRGEPMDDCVFGALDDPRVVAPDAGRARTRVALVPRRHAPGQWESFVEACRTVVDGAGVANAAVVVHAAEDRDAASELVAHLGLPEGSVVDTTDPQRLTALYRECQLVLSCRMHGAILAALSGAPAVLVDIDRGKARPIWERLGQPELVVAASAPPADLLVAADQARRPEVDAALQSRLVEVASGVVAHRARVVALVRTRPAPG